MDDFVIHTSATSSSTPNQNIKEENESHSSSSRSKQDSQTALSSELMSHAQKYIDEDPDTRLWSCVDLLSGKETSGKQYAIIILNQPITHKDTFFRIWDASSLRLCADGGANRLFDLFSSAVQRKK